MVHDGMAELLSGTAVERTIEATEKVIELEGKRGVRI
jgi:hypothetical protein